MQQRYYDPLAGRFLSTDPVAAGAASFNRYWYANNNPYKFTDPDGRQAFPMPVTPMTMRQMEAGKANAIRASAERAVLGDKSLVLSGGVTGMVGAPLVGNSPTSPSVTLIGNVSFAVNVTDFQFAFQASGTVAGGIGGGAMIGPEVGVSLSDGPLRTGLSSSETSFIQVSPNGSLNLGGSVNTSDTSVSAGFGVKGGAGNYVGAGTGVTGTATWASPALSDRKVSEVEK